jgi:hypothetical protein
MLSKLFDLIKKLMDAKFYGTVEVKFEAGNIVLVRKSETIKL